MKQIERKSIVGRGSPYGYAYESLAYRMPLKNMEPHLVTINEKSAEFQHEGEEFIRILEGKMGFCYEGTTYTLE